MKNIILFLFLFSFFTANSQHEFAPIGAKWVQNIGVDPNYGESFLEDFYILESLKDTVIGNKKFRLVNEYPLYQDGYKIYLWHGDSLNLIYDFGLNIGDTITYNILECGNITNIDFVVTNKAIFNLDGQDLIKLTHSPFIFENDYEIIERIGHINSAFENYDYYCTTIPGALSPWLRCYEDEDISYQSEHFLIFNQDDCEYRAINNIESISSSSFDIYPNPFKQSVTISLPADILYRFNEFELTNCKGQRVLSGNLQNEIIYLGNLVPGVYLLKITNGREYKITRIVKN